MGYADAFRSGYGVVSDRKRLEEQKREYDLNRMLAERELELKNQQLMEERRQFDVSNILERQRAMDDKFYKQGLVRANLRGTGAQAIGLGIEAEKNRLANEDQDRTAKIQALQQAESDRRYGGGMEVLSDRVSEEPKSEYDLAMESIARKEAAHREYQQDILRERATNLGIQATDSTPAKKTTARRASNFAEEEKENDKALKALETGDDFTLLNYLKQTMPNIADVKIGEDYVVIKKEGAWREGETQKMEAVKKDVVKQSIIGSRPKFLQPIDQKEAYKREQDEIQNKFKAIGLYQKYTDSLPATQEPLPYQEWSDKIGLIPKRSQSQSQQGLEDYQSYFKDKILNIRDRRSREGAMVEFAKQGQEQKEILERYLRDIEAKKKEKESKSSGESNIINTLRNILPLG